MLAESIGLWASVVSLINNSPWMVSGFYMRTRSQWHVTPANCRVNNYRVLLQLEYQLKLRHNKGTHTQHSSIEKDERDTLIMCAPYSIQSISSVSTRNSSFSHRGTCDGRIARLLMLVLMLGELRRHDFYCTLDALPVKF